MVLHGLRRDRVPEAVRALGMRLTPVQEAALRLASGRGGVRRRDLVAREGAQPSEAKGPAKGLSERRV